MRAPSALRRRGPCKNQRRGGLVGTRRVERGMLKTMRGRKANLCVESRLGKLHVTKNGTMCWRGRQWSRVGGVPSGGDVTAIGRGLDRWSCASQRFPRQGEKSMC